MPVRSPTRRRSRAAAALLVVVALATACTQDTRPQPRPSDWHPAPVVQGAPFRAFTSDSWWNTPLPRNAPVNPRADAILNYMSTAPQAGEGCLHLAGAGGSSWGQPVYWAQPGDPEYHVTVKNGDAPELRHLRIPERARSANNNDGSMSVFDLDRGYVVAFTDAAYDDGSRTWKASGASVTYLASNGLDVRTGEASDPRNLGSHRGNNGAVMMARLDEVAAGAIDHVLKVASGPEVSSKHVFPMVGSDGGSRDPAAPPQGLRFRIRPSVDLESLGLDPEALVIAKALQKYGFYIGDSSGVTALKVEDTRTEGRGQLWKTSATALCALPLTPQYWDVLPDGYQPPPPA